MSTMRRIAMTVYINAAILIVLWVLLEARTHTSDFRYCIVNGGRWLKCLF